MTTTLYILLYIIGYVAAYYSFKAGWKRATHKQWESGDALFNAFMSIMSWFWALVGLLLYTVGSDRNRQKYIDINN